MPRYSNPRRSRLFYIRLLFVPTLAIVGLVALLREEFAFRRQVQPHWLTISATVEDTRTRPLARYALEYGSKGLYEVDVLAAYQVDGSAQSEWVPLSEAPRSLTEAQAEAARMKGRQCTVRWDWQAPDQKIAEVR